LALGDIDGAGHWLQLEYDASLGGVVLANPAKGINVQGATGGGTDAVFWMNDQVVTQNFTVPSGKNAGSFGPDITINSGVVVTIAGNWTIV
jgi:hypothetical protein